MGVGCWRLGEGGAEVGLGATALPADNSVEGIPAAEGEDDRNRFWAGCWWSLSSEESAEAKLSPARGGLRFADGGLVVEFVGDVWRDS